MILTQISYCYIILNILTKIFIQDKINKYIWWCPHLVLIFRLFMLFIFVLVYWQRKGRMKEHYYLNVSIVICMFMLCLVYLKHCNLSPSELYHQHWRLIDLDNSQQQQQLLDQWSWWSQGSVGCDLENMTSVDTSGIIERYVVTSW